MAMTNPFPASSSLTYEQEILKFYDQMADLEGRQKNYTRTKDADEYRLERELEKLKARVTRSDILPQPQLSTTFHSSPDIQFQTQIMDESRRARNQDILAKLQELQMNASVFEARSERLRSMRKEYENLVQKYSSRRKFASMVLNERNGSRGRGHLEGDFGMTTTGKNLTLPVGPTQPIPMTLMVSTGVNTDITGAVRSVETSEEFTEPFPPRVIGINNTRLPSKTFATNDEAEKPSPMPIFFGRNKSTYVTPQVANQTKTRESGTKLYQHFMGGPDLSTSESDLEFTVTRDKDKYKNLFNQPILTDDSMSFSVPAPRNPSHVLSFTDSDDQSTFSILKLNSTEKHNESNNIRNKKNIEAEVQADDTVFRVGQTRNTYTPTARGMNGLAQDLAEVKQREREGGILNDSLTSPNVSAAESFIDSTVQNKTPDSLPRDESELENFTEEEKVDGAMDQSYMNDGQKNEDSESDPEGTQSDVSASAKMEEEIMEMKLGRDGDDFDNKELPSGSHLLGPTSLNNANTPSQKQEEFARDGNRTTSITSELNENEGKSAHFASKEKSELEKSLERPNATSFPLQPDSAEAKRHVRLKLDYEDSEESEGSEAPAAVTKSSVDTIRNQMNITPGADWKKNGDISAGGLQKKKQDLNDDFDDFFDI